MKAIYFGILVVAFISIIFSIMYVHEIKLSYMMLNDCNQNWDELQFKVINDRALKEIFDICKKEEIFLNDSLHNSNSYYLLKHSLKTFNCSRSLRTLNVSRPYVALASFPGSGNTWTRFLIEAATGIETGSVYRDGVFAGSKFCPARGKVFIVKTHEEDNSLKSHSDCRKIGMNRLNFTSAIYIIRNPYNAIIAEFNRIHKQRGTQMRVAPKISFNTSEWSEFVELSANTWRNMTLKWLQRKDIPVYVLIHERLIENVVLEIYKLTKFLNYKLEFKHVHCLSSNTTRKFKRKKPTWLAKENIYNNNLREVVNSAIVYVKQYVHPIRNISNVLDSYILQPSPH